MPKKQISALREIKKEECRRAILHAARDSFEAKGYYSATTSEIASAAHISAASLFNYFPSKLCLMEELENMKVHDFSKILESQSDHANSCLHNLMLIFDSYVEDLFIYPRLSFQISEFHAFGIFPNKENTKLRDSVYALIGEAVRHGELKSKTEPALIGSVFFSLGFSANVQGMAKDDCVRLFREFLCNCATDPCLIDE